MTPQRRRTATVDPAADSIVDTQRGWSDGVDPVGVDPATYRAVFRRYATGVVVITADAGHGAAGFTATSLASVSLRPPLVSFSVATSASVWPTLRAAGSLAVNFLAADQHELAARFATSGIDRFAAPTAWSRLATGEPALDDAPVRLRGVVEHRFEVGDHHLVVARVTAVALPGSAGCTATAPGGTRIPLVYYAGQYIAAGSYIGR